MLVETNSGYLVETDEDNFKSKKAPKDIDKKLENIFEKNKNEHEKLIDDIKKLINEYPEEVYAYAALDFVYVINNMEKESVELIKTIYSKFPDNLRAKISYMNDLAIEKRFEQIKEICGGEISVETIVGNKENLELPEYSIISEILIRYYMEIGEEKKALEYYNELKRFDCDITSIKHDLFPEFIDTLKEGDSVTVTGNYINEDKTNISDWQGRIAEIDLNENEVLIEWDSITLKNIKFEDIEELDEKDLMWYASYVPITNIKLSEARDTEEEADKAFDEINNKIIEKHKIPGFPYELYDQVKILDVRLGRILTDILSTMQEIRKTYTKYNLNKLADFIEIPVVELIKRLDDLESKGLIKTFYSSILKKDRERWVFLKTEENFEMYNKLQNKEISPKELEKIYSST